jgi:hypothetical protein
MPGGGEGVCGEDDGQGDHAEERVWESESLEDERVEHKSHPRGRQLYTFVKSRKDHSRGGKGGISGRLKIQGSLEEEEGER